MAYSDLEDLKTYMPERHLVQLTDQDDVNEIDEELVDDAILRADNTIDAYLRGRYPVPVTGTVPLEIQDISTKIASYNLYRKNMQLTLPDAIKDEYKQAISMLKDIQAGRMSPFESSDEPTIIVTNKVADDKVYDSDTWSTY